MEKTLHELLIYLDEIYPYNNKNDFDIAYGRIKNLSLMQRVILLEYSFKTYDIGFNMATALSFPEVWSDLEIENWKTLIIKMFPRKVKYSKSDLREINTGSYFDIILLNRILGICPFPFLFNSEEIDEVEKFHFYRYLKHFGYTFFYNKERELIEDVVNFYSLEVFEKIVYTSEKLRMDPVFSQWYNHEEICDLFKRFDLEIPG